MSPRDSAGPPFGELLRQFRTRAALSQAVLAERAGISTAAVGALEQGLRRAPYRHTVSQIARALDLSTTELAGLEDAAGSARTRRPPLAERGSRLFNNLPTLLTSFVQRQEVEEIAALVQEHRLVTVTGSGGVGKTRTAVEVARLKSDDVEICFIDLSPVRDGALIVSELASAFALPLDRRGDALSALASAIRNRDVLLVLDNCEHLVGAAAAVVAALLAACPRITILATSRERLALSSEVVYRLPSLETPTIHMLGKPSERVYAAIELFFARAQSVDRLFVRTEQRLMLVAEICRELDGIPLAIELAASRLSSLGLDALHTRLKQECTLSGSRDMPQRHRTMMATIAWSYELLSDAERALMRRLSVFAGTFSLDAAEQVCSDPSASAVGIAELLARLVEKSLVNLLAVDEATRYTMLVSIRAFATARLLEAGEHCRFARSHAVWLANAADSCAMDEATVTLARLRPDFENARAAVQWCLTSHSDDDALLAGRIVSGLALLCQYTGRQSDCIALLEATLERIDEERYPVNAALVWRSLAIAKPGAAASAAAARAKALSDRAGDTRLSASLNSIMSVAFSRRGMFVEAEALLEEDSLKVPDDDRISWPYISIIMNRSWARCAAGKIQEARRDLAEASRIMTMLGHDLLWENRRLLVLAEVEFADGKPHSAIAVCEQILARAGTHDLNHTKFVLSNLACYRLVLGDVEGAERDARQAISQWLAVGPIDTVILLQHLAAVAAVKHYAIVAAEILGFVNDFFLGEEFVRPFTEQRSYEILLETLKKQLSAQEIARLGAAGAHLRLEEARDVLFAALDSEETTAKPAIA